MFGQPFDGNLRIEPTRFIQSGLRVAIVAPERVRSGQIEVSKYKDS